MFHRLSIVWMCALMTVAACHDDDVIGQGRVDRDAVDSDALDVTAGGGAEDTIRADTGGAADSIASDTAASPDTAPSGGVFGDPCTTADDCNSGWCAQGADGLFCTKTCLEGCPDGFECRPVSDGGADPTFLCVDITATLCQPCEGHADCNNGVPAAPSLCLSFGDEGSFCGLNCGPLGYACPQGYTCQIFEDAVAGVASQCVPDDGAICECNGAARTLELNTACATSNAFGSCRGSRACGADGLSVCDAPTPAAETCNGADDDCDGATDEEIPPSTCPLDNAFGSCPGQTVCEQGEERCVGEPPTAEVCDGLDQNCDGVADEGFPNSDGDALADCVDDDDDDDGVADGDDDCPLVPNADQADLDFDGAGDACDPDADGDLTANDDDCAPLDATIHPSATELCNGLDDDCDGDTDEGFSNLDGDALADCVDDDDDGDGFIDEVDNCPVTPNDQTDLDGDGRGDACEDDLDGDLDPDLTDCAPNDPAIHAGAAELCNGVDDNCNEIADEGFPNTDGEGLADCLDEDDDGDGELDAADNCPLAFNPEQVDTDGDQLGDACDPDDDGDQDPDLTDCAPLDAAIHHAAGEVCGDLQDNDCDGATDEENAQGCADYYFNQDGDAFGLAIATKCLCAPTAPYTATQPGDCNDQNPQVFPEATETCGNSIDDDCDGEVDEPGAVNCAPFYRDADQDSWGVESDMACLCGPQIGYASKLGDCDDDDPAINPGATERCGGADEDCDGATDEEGAQLCQSFYFDGDGDTYGVSGDSRCLCAAEGDYRAAVGGDCNDLDAANYPSNVEICDEADNNCNGQVDEGVQRTFFLDHDGDGVGGASTTQACALPDGYAELTGDCNDFNAAVNPQATEVCGNNLDDDCNEQVDEENAEGCEVYYFNQDGDAFGVDVASRCLCQAAAPYTATEAGDCNDQNPQVFPNGTEVCGNNADDDCDGAVDEAGGLNCDTFWVDADHDGWGDGEAATSCLCGPASGFADRAGDCDDDDAGINPGAAEVCGNAISEDCDAAIDEEGAEGCQPYYFDGDGDGWGLAGDKRCLCAPEGDYRALNVGDCNDGDGDNHPTNAEVCDGEDNNCNGEADEGVKQTFYRDNDGDGFGGTTTAQGCVAPAGFVAGGGDCNDYNQAINPDAPEVCNEVDDDCNGFTDDGLATRTLYKDNDGDGFAAVNAATRDKCDVPVGWTVARDDDGDGTHEWDCDDSDVTVYPFAPTVCGDSKDNDCDGYVDRLCFTPCAGDWPYQLDFTTGIVDVSLADLDGNGNYEVIVQDSWGFALLDSRGAPLWEYSASGLNNYSRGEALVADIDDYDSFGAGVQTLEVLTGNGSTPTFYKLNADFSVSVLDQVSIAPGVSAQVYDASRFLIADLDRDGAPDWLATSWCADDQAVRRFEYDPTTSEIVHLQDFASPEAGVCQYYNGRVLTDLDGDGDLELLYGNGYGRPEIPSYWSGRIYLIDPLVGVPYCPGGGTPGFDCFATAIEGLFSADVRNLHRVGDEIRAQVTYFTDDEPNVQNVGTTRYWRFDLLGQPLGPPSSVDSLWLDGVDLDRDGVPETVSDAAAMGLFDVNGDRLPDKLTTVGDAITVSLYDPDSHSFIENPGSRRSLGGEWVRARAAWDIDADGRLELLSFDNVGKVHCQQLGRDTWNKRDVVPPRITQVMRTWQWDNFEPNEGADADADGLPDLDALIRLPSALTALGGFYSYISSADDVDTYLVNTSWGGNVCLLSPRGVPYRLAVYGFDHGADKPPGLIWESPGVAEWQCFYGSVVAPPRYGEYRFIVQVSPVDGAFTPYWPYWIQALK